MKRIAFVITILLLISLTASTNPAFISSVSASPPEDVQQALYQAQGKITFLRVHQLGSGYGPPTDFIDVEVVVKLNTLPNNSFGFQLRNDNGLPAHQGMLDLLRDAFNNNWTAVIDFDLPDGKTNGTIIRVAVIK